MKLTFLRPLIITAVGLLAVAPLADAEVTISGSEMEGVPLVSIEGSNTPGVEFPSDEKQFSLTIPAAKQDWTGLKTLTIRLYSPSASGAAIWVLFRDAADTKSPKEFPLQYWHIVIKPNWAGWKDVEIPLESLNQARVVGVPVKVTQIILRNQFGPSDPAKNDFGIPTPLAGTWGIGYVVVK